MPLIKKKGEGLSKDLQAKINGARDNLQKTAPKRDEAWEFFRGNHFAYLNERGQLDFRPDGGIGIRKRGKPAHRARQARNLIFDVVLRESANASQQVPSYQVVPATTDPQDAGAAKLAEKLALYGYSRWGLRKATIDAVEHAVVGGEAFAWVYFDTTIGPFVQTMDGGPPIGQGDVRVRIYGGNEVYWEPGLRFDDSPYHVVEQASSPEQVEQMQGYLLPRGRLSPDANARGVSRTRSDKAKLVLVTHYLERPCPEYPRGRWLTMANNKQILPERPYPSPDGTPILRQLTYAPDPDSDRDLGLVAQLLDPQRTVNDAENKAVEWKNLCLFPQMIVAPGMLKKQRRTDEPGHILEVPNPDQNVKVLDVPPVPESLFTMADRGKEDILRIGAQQDIPPGVESGKAIQALIEKNQAREAMFIASLAEFHANVMHDCLVQVQENYTEPRLIQVKGDFGWESIPDFKGAQMRDQVDVRVYTDSIEPQTKQAREQRIMNYIQMGAVTPEEGMTAIETGATEGLIRSFAKDEARVGRIIQALKRGPEALGQMGNLPNGRLTQEPVIDQMTGQPVMDPTTGQPAVRTVPEMAPAWMPRYSDNLELFRTIFEDWLKTEDYEQQPPPIQAAANEVYAGLLQLEAEKAAEEQAAQMAQAEQQGMNNAAAPQMKPNPSLPALNGAEQSAQQG